MGDFLFYVDYVENPGSRSPQSWLRLSTIVVVCPPSPLSSIMLNASGISIRQVHYN